MGSVVALPQVGGLHHRYEALRDAMHGVRYLSPVLGKNFEDIRFKDQGFQSSYQLTSRQRDVLRLLGSGCTMKEAGATLGITASLPSLKFLYICSPSG
jgi:DNA-binding NarL/FixJ family response regulator